MTHSNNDLELQILIVDDHQFILGGAVHMIQDQYPKATIVTATNQEEALAAAEQNNLSLAIVDLSIPAQVGQEARTENGIHLLKELMGCYPTLNLMVQSSNLKPLIRLRHEIDHHQGGFTLADKSLPIADILTRLDWSLQGLTHTKDLKMDLELKPEWLEVMHLAFEEGLQDKAIAKAIFKSERMIRHYWAKIQDLLEVYPEEGQNIRAVTRIRAREAGFID